ncbi:MAG: heme ABC transporter permease [Rickettsiaceae bacterium]|nr:heme ABC transporter permease [Rickettsiaceae bacterium]
MTIQFLTPQFFAKVEKTLIPLLAILFPFVLSVGLYFALFSSPADYQQGEMVRIMYVHVPSAWMSLGIYSFMAICSFSSLVWKTRISYLMSVASAPIGAAFALITLVTGSLWGKPIWGTWWVWDARLTSMLILFLLYLSYISVTNSGTNILRAEKPASVIAIIGFINIPIVKFSVDIWYSLHQPASVFKMSGPSIHSSILLPLMIMFASFICFFLLSLLMRTRILLNNIKYNNGRIN